MHAHKAVVMISAEHCNSTEHPIDESLTLCTEANSRFTVTHSMRTVRQYRIVAARGPPAIASGSTYVL